MGCANITGLEGLTGRYFLSFLLSPLQESQPRAISNISLVHGLVCFCLRTDFFCHVMEVP